MKLEEYLLGLKNAIDCIYGLKLNGVKDSDEVEFSEMKHGRFKVTVNGEYYGIWDITRRTFVD